MKKILILLAALPLLLSSWMDLTGENPYEADLQMFSFRLALPAPYSGRDLTGVEVVVTNVNDNSS